MKRKTLRSLKTISLSSIALMLALAGTLAVLRPGQADAAALSQVMVRFDRLMISQATTGTVCAKPATTATEASVQVVYPTGYTLGAAGTFTVGTTDLAWPSGASAWPGIGTATNVSSQTVTFPSGDLSVGTLYCFNWTSSAAVQVKSSASSSNTGSVTTRDNVPSAIDTASYGTASLSDDQISVSASVPQSFSFALSGTTDALGALSTGSVTSSPTPRTVTLNTNAGNGWMVWAQDANGGLRSTAANHTITSATGTLSAGTEGHNFGVTSSQGGGSGTITLAAAFDGTSANHGGGLTTALQQLATSNGTANNAVLTLKNNAAISTMTSAASDYSDVITVVGAGLF